MNLLADSNPDLIETQTYQQMLTFSILTPYAKFMARKLSGVIFIDKAPFLTDPQIAVISEILRNSALIILGAEILPYLFGTVDKPTTAIVVLGSVLTFLLFIISILLVRNIDKK